MYYLAAGKMKVYPPPENDESNNGDAKTAENGADNGENQLYSTVTLVTTGCHGRLVCNHDIN